MSVSELADVLKDLAQLDTHLFKTTQQSIEHDIHTFVSAFDDDKDAFSPDDMTTRHPSPDDLATAFIQLNSCQTHLDQANKQGFSDLTHERNAMQQALEQVNIILNQQEKRDSNASREAQRQAFLDQLAQRRKQEEQDLQREYDRLDEHYAKKTRESIYQNLVGSNAWLNGHSS
ncbi:hypothetical protein [Absidia glauca]|uniref:Biogenesis of lysosome-related organelles complex 1 subunit 5 n=1 Tax=Absidia glauca TaxID=4829 RepID=A0A163JGS2_ABSGL|nr:hypothetical protein [Absidia glauca]